MNEMVDIFLGQDFKFWYRNGKYDITIGCFAEQSKDCVAEIVNVDYIDKVFSREGIKPRNYEDLNTKFYYFLAFLLLTGKFSFEDYMLKPEVMGSIYKGIGRVRAFYANDYFPLMSTVEPLINNRWFEYGTKYRVDSFIYPDKLLLLDRCNNELIVDKDDIDLTKMSNIVKGRTGDNLDNLYIVKMTADGGIYLYSLGLIEGELPVYNFCDDFKLNKTLSTVILPTFAILNSLIDSFSFDTTIREAQEYINNMWNCGFSEVAKNNPSSIDTAESLIKCLDGIGYRYLVYSYDFKSLEEKKDPKEVINILDLWTKQVHSVPAEDFVFFQLNFSDILNNNIFDSTCPQVKKLEDLIIPKDKLNLALTKLLVLKEDAKPIVGKRISLKYSNFINKSLGISKELSDTFNFIYDLDGEVYCSFKHMTNGGSWLGLKTQKPFYINIKDILSNEPCNKNKLILKELELEDR